MSIQQSHSSHMASACTFWLTIASSWQDQQKHLMEELVLSFYSHRYSCKELYEWTRSYTKLKTGKLSITCGIELHVSLLKISFLVKNLKNYSHLSRFVCSILGLPNFLYSALYLFTSLLTIPLLRLPLLFLIFRKK